MRTRRGVPPSRSQTPEQSGPDAVEAAALEYARQLPALLRRALKRAARGKPSPLLRSAPRLIRESMQLLDMHEQRHQRQPKPIAGLDDLGPLSDYERAVCTDTVLLMRQTREALAAEPPTESSPQPLPPQEPPPPPAAPAARPLYNGPDRRVQHIPRNVHLGTKERRQSQEHQSIQIDAGVRRLWIGAPPETP